MLSWTCSYNRDERGPNLTYLLFHQVVRRLQVHDTLPPEPVQLSGVDASPLLTIIRRSPRYGLKNNRPANVDRRGNHVMVCFLFYSF